MLKRQPLYKLIFILTPLFACNNPQDNRTIENNQIDTISEDKQSNIIHDTIDYFRKAVENLANINFFISGHDSIVVSNDPTDFIEMNGVRNCFQNPFDKSDSGLIAYRQLDNVKKFHVAKNKKQNGPSANIIQISFADTSSSTKWFDRLSKSKEFEYVKMKPKTEIWLQNKYVYFIQSYYDPDRQILNEITNKFRETLD